MPFEWCDYLVEVKGDEANKDSGDKFLKNYQLDHFWMLCC